MFERFTDRARKVMALANQEAQRFNHEYIGTEHILLGLVKEGSGVGANVLKNLDVDLRKVRLEVEKLVKSGPDMVTMGKLPQTPRAKKVIEYAIEEARNLNHNYVGTEHLLLGLLREHDGVAAQVLMNLGLKLEEVREEVLNLLGAGVESEEPQAQEKQGQSRKSKTPALDSFGRDLTELAREGQLDPVIGRMKEIERVIQILCRRQKNNPVLLGEAGVGKTAIVEGLAQMVISSTVPELLHDPPIVQQFRHGAGDDHLGQPLDDGGLADARFAQKDGVIFLPPAKDLDDPLDLFHSTDDRVKLSFPREFGQIATEAVQRGCFALAALPLFFLCLGFFAFHTSSQKIQNLFPDFL